MEVLLKLHNRGSILKNFPRDSLLCLRTDSRYSMYLCEDTRLLSLVRSGDSENVAVDTLVWHLPEHLYTLCLLSPCVHTVSSD